MNYDMSFEFAHTLCVLKNGEKCLLASRKNNKRCFISLKVYEVLLEAIEQKAAIKDLLDFFETKEDRDYIVSVLGKLINAEMIVQQKENSQDRTFDTASLIVTDKCNLSCIHCCQNAGGKARKRELETKEWMRVIKKLAALKVQAITVTGGEPLSRKDIKEISLFLRENFEGKLILLTNGMLINADNAEWIAKVYDGVSISMDGCNEELTSFIRGKGVYEKVLDSVSILQKHGYNNIMLSAVLPCSEEVNREFEALCDHLQVKPQIRYLTKMGRASDNYDLIQEKFREYVNRNGYEEYVFEEREDAANLRSCIAAQARNITISSIGTVYPCNLLQDSTFGAESIECMVNNKEIEKLFKFEGSICEECCVNVFCWACISDYALLRNDKQKLYERCMLKKDHLIKTIWGDEYVDDSVDNKAM